MFNWKELDKKHNEKLYKDFEPIMELDAKNFDLRTSYGEWLILFSAPWCDSCAAIEESLREVAKGASSFSWRDFVRFADSTQRRHFPYPYRRSILP